MGIIKIVAMVLALVIVVTILAGVVALGIGTVRYMTDQKFNFIDAIHWAWDDMVNWVKSTFGIKENDENAPIQFGYTNQYVEVVACTSLWK